VVVVAGDTDIPPIEPTVPMPWSMLTAVASDTLQLSIDDSPEPMVSGAAVKELMVGKAVAGGGGAVETIT